MMQLLFWISALLLLYIYLGYPLLLRFLPRSKPAPVPAGAEEIYPSVTVIIPAYNEADHIEATVTNKLAQDYPADKLQIIVVSDESEDDTDEIVQRIAEQHPNVQLLRQVPRQGKTAGLNLAMQQVSSEIVVFSDANSHYAPDAIKQLTQCFNDQSIGYVTGKMVYTNSDGSLVGDGCSAYMKYENHLRSLETHTGSVVGVDGGIDAIRTELYQPMNADQLPDFVLPLKVVSQGKRVGYCPEALLNEEALNSADSEFRMRVRVSLRAYWALWDMRHLFNPKRFGIFSLQLVSHKLLRYLAFLPLIVAFITAALLSGQSLFYSAAFFGQLAFYVAAVYAGTTGSSNRWLGLANYFCLINFAAMLAFINFVKGEKIVIWKPRVG
ncbi:glycosyltransferase family 2 protein [Simiduia aestuariiviva]|uniref:Cellulose synthase/poly-beta-1,6-N-acetylglucosamine synthase-like glycosyltransferase n=1 Tax=Simiduia aestuariiviva TaxID=1510459 RepID=A0A839UQN4_9GAMM|nr:glycosyltransferase family 2 protein [Simiduia aestuariiviva]MBB3170093.1 cellulose synthase/poly-beta-1,6-N-acetylglucosamine synthase-like glycosyltransferase [Simiduia aestuariiviva]